MIVSFGLGPWTYQISCLSSTKLNLKLRNSMQISESAYVRAVFHSLFIFTLIAIAIYRDLNYSYIIAKARN